MALRVTQGMMYNSFVNNMNSTLSAMTDSNLQGATHKKVNRPSDDPIAAGRIIAYRSNIDNMETYDENIKQAMGWLGIADGVLASGDGSVQTLLRQIMVKAEQAASGTYDDANREQISFEIRQNFMQLINLANTPYNGRSIFAGHKTDAPAYVEGLAVTCKDSTAGSIAEADFNVLGASKKTVLIQAISASGSTTPVQIGTTTSPHADISYRYSDDGGKTWKAATYTDGVPVAGQGQIVAGSVSVNISDNTKTVTPVNPDDVHSTSNGTWLYVRPTAIYQGDDNNTQVTQQYGTPVTARAEGTFPRDVSVRIDGNVAGPPAQLLYSYSTDDGNNWTQATAPNTGTFPMGLPIPGGYLNVDAIPAVGSQFVVHPHRADINFQISESDSITVNMVGSEIFGGLYNYPEDGIGYPVPVQGLSSNLFETMGNFIAALETNSQEGCQKALDEMKECMNVVLTKAAVVGGRENRLIITQGSLSIRSFSETTNLSATEDVDVTELMTRLAQQQVAYNSVLKSSSMIMQMSLLNFL